MVLSRLCRVLSIVLGIPCFAATALSANDTEMRGLWVDSWGAGFLKASEVTQLVEEARANNFNALFVQMRSRGFAFYMPQAPNSEPRIPATVVSPWFDALADTRRSNDPELNFIVEASDDMLTWTALDGQEQVDSICGSLEAVTIIDTNGLPPYSDRFLRLRVE